MPRDRIVQEIDDVANSVEFLGKRYPRQASSLKKLATRLDMISNQLEKNPRSRVAAETTERLPGEWGPEDEYQDSYEASDYHKVPVGKDSLAKAIDKNIPDILSDLDFAQATNGRDNHRIYVQANRRGRINRPSGGNRQASWPFRDLSPNDLNNYARMGRWDLLRRAADMAMGSRRAANEVPMEVSEDKIGSEDNLSTADLAESGDEDDVRPVDRDEQGGTLQFYGTYPVGDGPDSGHHRRGIEPPNRERRLSNRNIRSRARQTLQRMADREVPVVVKQPDRLMDDEPGDDVERDHPLGGLSGTYRGSEPTPRRQSSRSGSSRYASVKLYRPTHVPKELHSFWHGAAQYLSNKGTLLTASGRVNYRAVNNQYIRLISHMGRVAAQADNE